MSKAESRPFPIFRNGFGMQIVQISSSQTGQLPDSWNRRVWEPDGILRTEIRAQLTQVNQDYTSKDEVVGARPLIAIRQFLCAIGSVDGNVDEGTFKVDKPFNGECQDHQQG